MAKILNKDQTTYNKERDGFIRDLQHFHETRGTPFRRCPKLSGQEVDLYLLYSLVTAQGGWMKVNSRNEWNALFEQFNLPSKCVNSGVALKQIYLRYLDRYEKVHYLGEEADRGSDDDEESRHKRWSARALHSVPLTYNYHQHNIADSIRSYNGLSDNLYKASDYERLTLSLISPLPNEQDFAVNVCTLMCNEGKHTLKLDKCPRLVDYLLAHTGVYNHESMRAVFTEVYSNIRKHSLNSFWSDALECNEWIDLVDETRFVDKPKKTVPASNPATKIETTVQNKQAFPESQCSGGDSERLKCSDLNKCSELDSDSELLTNEECVIELLNVTKVFKLSLDITDKELFCIGRTLGTQEYVGQRVLQIAQILRNLSFTEDNMLILSKNRTFMRFLLLCVNSKWNSIQQLGLDMLSNISSEIFLNDNKDRLTECLMIFVTNGLLSSDRAIIIACLEILNKLSQREANEDFMLKYLERKTYAQVCSFLTLHDVMLLIYTLECLYSLSSLGERACNYIVDVHGIIDTLVSLVTVEGKSYGPKACIGMKLVETVPGISTAPPQQNVQTPSPSVNVVPQTPTSSHVNTILKLSTPIVTRTEIRKVMVNHPSTVNTPLLPVPAPQIVTPQLLIQQQHAHQQAIQENEQFALAWLRATYEPSNNGKIEQQELYKQYLNSCSKIGRKGLISPLHFPRCVRSVFGGTVGPNPMKGNDGVNVQMYEGIKARPVPLIINFQSTINQQPSTSAVKIITPRRAKGQISVSTSALNTSMATDGPMDIPVSPASPILKAQLSAPPKTRDSPTKLDAKSQVLAHPHLSQALLGSNNASPGTSKETVVSAGTGQSNTSLIKSLLATKVNESMIPISMKTPALAPAANLDCQTVVKVAQRQLQQRMINSHGQLTSTSATIPPPQTFTGVNKKLLPKPMPKNDMKSKLARMNGARLGDDNETIPSSLQIVENHVSSSSTSLGSVNSAFRGHREPPQPPPPPLAPLSSNSTNSRAKTPRMDMEDSDSTGNNSIASSTGVSCSNIALSGGVSSTEDGENSLTSFEGILLNGIPHSLDIDAPCNDDSNSKDSLRNSMTNKPPTKSLMLADLLEKKVEKDPPIMNGVVGKELRIGDKGLELVDNHINKILSITPNSNECKENISVNSETFRTPEQISERINSVCKLEEDVKLGVKRPAEDDISDRDVKKPNMSSSVIVSNNTVNGNMNVDSPKTESVDSSNGDDVGNASVSATAANLYAALAADALEDEDEEILQETLPQAITEEINPVQVVQGAVPGMYIGGQTETGQQLIVTAAPRQIIVSQGQIPTSNQQVLITTAGQIIQQTVPGQMKSSAGQSTMPLLVQTSPGQQRTPVMLSQGNSTPVLVHGPQGQVQLITSGSQAGQYVLSTSGSQGQTHYMVAQPQTALVQGQPQTVLVAQTSQQQGTGSKTIIILQPQAAAGTPAHHQKVVVTPQGQQVVVTQVQRPIVQQSVTNNIPALVPTTTNTKTTQATVITGSLNSSLIQNSIVSGNSTVPVKVMVSSQKEDLTSRPVTPNANELNNSSVKPANLPSSPAIIRDYSHPYICEWRDCPSIKKYMSANEVYMHACESHCPTGSEEIQCLWDRCDNMKRKRFSLMTHLLDRHCSNEVMKMMCARRKQLSQSGRTEIPAPLPTPPHPGYAPDAALHAIKRHALEFVNPKELQQKLTKPGTAAVAVASRPSPHPVEQDDNEGPVTKSIRLTASLILRNLVIYSNNSRRYLRHYEPHLAGVALSNVESSRTIAQMLYDLNESSTSRR